MPEGSIQVTSHKSLEIPNSWPLIPNLCSTFISNFYISLFLPLSPML